MKESTMKVLKKVHDACESTELWSGFLGAYTVLLAGNLLLSAFAEEKPKWWWSAIIGAGMGSAFYNFRKARRIRAEKKNAE